jgi:hypothetical protein
MAWFGYDQGVFSGVLISAGEKYSQAVYVASVSQSLNSQQISKSTFLKRMIRIYLE